MSKISMIFQSEGERKLNIDVKNKYGPIGALLGLIVGFLLEWLLGITLIVVIGLILYLSHRDYDSVNLFVFGIIGAVIGGILGAVFLVSLL